MESSSENRIRKSARIDNFLQESGTEFMISDFMNDFK